MRFALTALLVLAFATTALASDPISVRTAQQATTPEIDDGRFYMQPPHVYWWTINASSPFGSELADDIPADLGEMALSGVIFYALEWGGYWSNPAGFTIGIYGEDCPPDLDGTQFYYAWGNPGMSSVIVYDDPGWMTAYEITQMFDEPLCLAPPVSIGFQLDLTWGPNPPYGGVTMTNDYDVYGCGQAYWDGTYWGYPRWGTVSGFFGTQADVAYGLLGELGPTATENTTWGAVKELYR
jgi:hypothetical protein